MAESLPGFPLTSFVPSHGPKTSIREECSTFPINVNDLQPMLYVIYVGKAQKNHKVQSVRQSKVVRFGHESNNCVPQLF